MALAFDALSTGTETGSVSSITWNHTCAAGAILVVCGGFIATGITPTCTYNSVSMTLVTGADTEGNSAHSSIFILLNPASGVNAISLSAGTGVSDMDGCAVSFTGANTSTQPDGKSQTVFGAAATGTHFTSTITTASSLDATVAFWVATTSSAVTIPAGQTTILNKTGSRLYAASYVTGVSVGSNSQYITIGGTAAPTGVMVGIQPGTTATNTSQFMPFFRP